MPYIPTSPDTTLATTITTTALAAATAATIVMLWSLVNESRTRAHITRTRTRGQLPQPMPAWIPRTTTIAIITLAGAALTALAGASLHTSAERSAHADTLSTYREAIKTEYDITHIDVEQLAFPDTHPGTKLATYGTTPATLASPTTAPTSTNVTLIWTGQHFALYTANTTPLTELPQP